MIALDTNILVYAVDRTDDPRHAIASAMMPRAIQDGWILPVQVLAEFLNVAWRKRNDLQVPALQAATALRFGCTLAPSSDTDLLDAFHLAQRHRLNYFDALILTVAARAGATTLYSEDMQDGLALGILKVVNPFLGQPEG